MSDTPPPDLLEAPPAEALDLAQVRAFLASRYSDRAEAISELGRGAWSVAYGFRHAGNDYVARFGRQREDFDKDRLAAAYASTSLPIPRIIEIGDAFDGFYAVSERAFGGYLDLLDEAEMRSVLPRWFAALDAARSADISSTTGYGGWDATGNAPHASWQTALLDVATDVPSKRTHGWREQMAASPLGCGPFDEALACLRDLVTRCPGDRHLLHSDPLNRNILVRDGRISAVIDWGCGMYGDFLYDLAHLSFSTLWYPQWRAIDFAAEARRHYEAIGLDVPNFAERLRCYEIHIGLDAAAYNAFRGRWDEFEAITRRTREAVSSTT